MERSDGNCGPHFLLLPFVEQGHINPMLNLASQLAAITTLDCKVTFLNASQAISAEVLGSSGDATQVGSNGSSNGLHSCDLHVEDDECMGNKLQFVTLLSTPPSAPPLPHAPPADHQLFQHVSMTARHTILKQKMVALEKLAGPLIEKLVVDSKEFRPISSIICDMFLWKWVLQIAVKHAVKVALLVPCSAVAFFETAYAPRIGKAAAMEELLVSAFNMPGMGDPRRLGLFSMRDSAELRRQKFEYFKNLGEGIEQAGFHHLVNSYKGLEEPLLPFIEEAGVKVTFIGGAAGGDDNLCVGSRRAQRAGGAPAQEEECMPWLDGQERRSVLFVSFGSEGVLEETQVQEIAMGIEQSGYPFLWVVRPDMPTFSRPPEDFCQRSRRQGRGMFVAWAPQRAVLQHAAVGAFLTHSGWNSTLESLSCGVPMLCLPLLGDQPLNANLVHSFWKVGLRLQQHYSTASCGQFLLSRGDVESGVRALMEGRFSQHSAHFQRLAQLSIQEGQRDLISFVQSIT